MLCFWQQFRVFFLEKLYVKSPPVLTLFWLRLYKLGDCLPPKYPTIIKYYYTWVLRCFSKAYTLQWNEIGLGHVGRKLMTFRFFGTLFNKLCVSLSVCRFSYGHQRCRYLLTNFYETVWASSHWKYFCLYMF
jgi:hypothetical protein